MSFPVQLVHFITKRSVFLLSIGRRERVATELQNVAVISITKYFSSTDQLQNTLLKYVYLKLKYVCKWDDTGEQSCDSRLYSPALQVDRDIRLLPQTSTISVAFNSLSTNLTTKIIARHKQLTCEASFNIDSWRRAASHVTACGKKEWNCFDASNAFFGTRECQTTFRFAFHPNVILPPCANIIATLKQPFAWKRKKKSDSMLQEFKEKNKNKTEAQHDAFKSLEWFFSFTVLLSAV